MNNNDSKRQNLTFDGRTTEVIVRKKNVSNKIKGGQFSAISRLSNARSNYRGGKMKNDIFDLLDQVSKGAFSVFNNLKYNRSEINNITRYSTTESLSKTEKEVLSRRIRELKNVDLIRSVKKRIPSQKDPDVVFTFNDPRKTYVINPVMIRCRDFDEAAYLWDNCH